MTQPIEKLKSKLKSSALVTLVLGIISITWLIIDYFVIQTIITEGELSKFSLEWILLITSGLAFIAFHISVFFTLFYVLRVLVKIKPQKNQHEREKPDKEEEVTNQ